MRTRRAFERVGRLAVWTNGQGGGGTRGVRRRRIVIKLQTCRRLGVISERQSRASHTGASILEASNGGNTPGSPRLGPDSVGEPRDFGVQRRPSRVPRDLPPIRVRHRSLAGAHRVLRIGVQVITQILAVWLTSTVSAGPPTWLNGDGAAN